MHYWYDERSAGGLKQKEEKPPLLTSTEELLRRPFIAIEIPYVFTRVHYVLDDRTRTLRFWLIRTRGCFYKRR